MFKSLTASLALTLSMQAGIKDGANLKFLEKHCYDCHDEDIQKGKFDIASLKFNPTDFKNAQKWLKVYDMIATGDMPPKKKKRPDTAQKDAFLADLEKPLLEADEKRQLNQGRAKARRLNRAEFEETLSELLQVPLDIKEMLPEDASKDGFDTVGEALNVSSVQIEAYLNAIEYALDKATVLREKPATKKYTMNYDESLPIMQTYRAGGPFHIEDGGGITFFTPQKHSFLNPSLAQYTVPFDGKYKVSLKAQAKRSEKPLTLTVRAGGQGHIEQSSVAKTLLGYVSTDSELKTYSFEGYLIQDQVLRIYPTNLPHLRFPPKAAGVTQRNFKGPGIFIRDITVEGPLISHWPPKSHEVLWGGVTLGKIADAKPNIDPNKHLERKPDKIAKPRMTRKPKGSKSKTNFIYSKKQKLGGELCFKTAGKVREWRTLELKPVDPKADAQRLISKFIPKAFRRDVSLEEKQVYIDLVNYWLDEGISFEESMRAGYKAILTSPQFLYQKPAFEPEENEITGLAMSERLSYFLWSSTPDELLLKDAKSGKLLEDEVLAAHVERMLKDPRAESFLENFLGQWMDLRNMDFTEPDEKLYPEFDDILKWSMKEEVISFFRELMQKDLSVENVADSEFVMINDRLAEHYGLPAVKGTHIRRVELPKESVRGGVLGMAAIHKVTANGASTSPVVRGVWVLERVMGIHPPPPPTSVPAIEPDIRGTKTVLDQLEKHRESSSCTSCHQLIDPPGVALEVFDVIGQLRQNYRQYKPGKESEKIRYKPGKAVPIFYDQGLPVVAGYTMKDGEKFKNFNEFKALLLKNPDKVAKNVAEKLVTYATGSGISVSDRKDIDKIVAAVKTKNYGFRSLIHEVVKSQIFQRK